MGAPRVWSWEWNAKPRGCKQLQPQCRSRTRSEASMLGCISHHSSLSSGANGTELQVPSLSWESLFKAWKAEQLKLNPALALLAWRDQATDQPVPHIHFLASQGNSPSEYFFWKRIAEKECLPYCMEYLSISHHLSHTIMCRAPGQVLGDTKRHRAW